MQATIKTAIISLLLALGATAQSNAQSTLVQTLNIKLTAVDQVTETTVRQIRITTKDVANLFAGTTVRSGQLLLVTPNGNAPGTIGNLNAFLRVVSGNTIVTDVPSPDSFNLFQDAAAVSTSGTRATTRAINRFSIDFGAFHAELQGFSTWNSVQRTVGGVDLSGTGAFTSSVNGSGTVDGVTHGSAPMQGTISASAPKAGS